MLISVINIYKGVASQKCQSNAWRYFMIPRAIFILYISPFLNKANHPPKLVITF